MSLVAHNSTKRFKSGYSQATLHSFMNKKTRYEIVAADGFPPSAVCKSEFICQAFNDKGKVLQKNPDHIMQLVHKPYDVVMMEMQQSLTRGNWFNLSLDEYSSHRHKRYLNINVHQDKNVLWNLRMVAIITTSCRLKHPIQEADTS